MLDLQSSKSSTRNVTLGFRVNPPFLIAATVLHNQTVDNGRNIFSRGYIKATDGFYLDLLSLCGAVAGAIGASWGFLGLPQASLKKYSDKLFSGCFTLCILL